LIAGWIIMGGLTGCVDYDGVTEANGADTVVVNAQFQRDVSPILELRCGIGGCHSKISHQAGLVLTPDSAYGALVGRPSQTRGGQVLVRPGDAENSFMVNAIRDDSGKRLGLARMPLASGPLTPNQIQTIVNWVNRGAPHD